MVQEAVAAEYAANQEEEEKEEKEEKGNGDGWDTDLTEAAKERCREFMSWCPCLFPCVNRAGTGASNHTEDACRVWLQLALAEERGDTDDEVS